MEPLNSIAAPLLLLLSACQGVFAEESKSNYTTSPCQYVTCSSAFKCCQPGVDEYGWIAAAVGWSLWFLTLILLCIDKLTKLRPDEPKYLEA